MKNHTNINLIQLFVSLSFLFLANTILAQTDWELQKEEGPLRAYTREIEGYSFKETKVVGRGKADLLSSIALMQQPDHYVEFMPNCLASRLMERKGDTSHIHYILSKAPWPVSNRDGYYEFKYTYHPDSNMVKVDFRAIPNYGPEEEDVVRVQTSFGHWKLINHPNGELELEYRVFVDPGGSLPSWLANLTVIDLPFGTVKEAFEQSKKAKYKDQQFSFLK